MKDPKKAYRSVRQIHINQRRPDGFRHLRDGRGKWVVRDDVKITFGDRSGGLTQRSWVLDHTRRWRGGYTGYGGSSHIGPELQFGHVVGDYFKEPVLLIKTAWGGKRTENRGQKTEDRRQRTDNLTSVNLTSKLLLLISEF